MIKKEAEEKRLWWEFQKSKGSLSGGQRAKGGRPASKSWVSLTSELLSLPKEDVNWFLLEVRKKWQWVTWNFRKGKKIIATVKEGALQSLLTVHSTWMKCPVLSQPQVCRGTLYLHAGLRGWQDEGFWEHSSELWALFWRLGFSSTSFCHLSHPVSPRHWDGTARHLTAQMRHDKSELICSDKLFPDFLSLPYRCSQQFSLERLTYAWLEVS